MRQNLILIMLIGFFFPNMLLGRTHKVKLVKNLRVATEISGYKEPEYQHGAIYGLVNIKKCNFRIGIIDKNKNNQFNNENGDLLFVAAAGDSVIYSDVNCNMQLCKLKKTPILLKVDDFYFIITKLDYIKNEIILKKAKFIDKPDLILYTKVPSLKLVSFPRKDSINLRDCLQKGKKTYYYFWMPNEVVNVLLEKTNEFASTHKDSFNFVAICKENTKAIPTELKFEEVFGFRSISCIHLNLNWETYVKFSMQGFYPSGFIANDKGDIIEKNIPLTKFLKKYE